MTSLDDDFLCTDVIREMLDDPQQQQHPHFRSLNTCILDEAAFCRHKRPLADGADIDLR